MNRVPGRDTRNATSSKRRTWYGYGTLTRTEKPPAGRYLHDVTFVFSDLSVLGLPAILVAFAYADPSPYGVSAATLVGWLTMTAVGAAIRGGWISPLATDIPGWVSLAPTLLVFRLLYHNVAFLVIAFGSTWLAGQLGVAPLSLFFAMATGVLAVMLFPRAGGSTYRAIHGDGNESGKTGTWLE